MTDTQPEPTDAGLWQLHMQMPGQHKDPIDFARAVLARWGQPAHSGKSFQTYGETRAYSKGYYAGKKAALVSQPSPAAPPAACEPLIRQMRNALALPCDRWNATQSRIVREAIDAADAWLDGK